MTKQTSMMHQNKKIPFIKQNIVLYHICYKACPRANFCETLLSMKMRKQLLFFFKQSATQKWGVRGVAGVWDVCVGGVWGVVGVCVGSEVCWVCVGCVAFVCGVWVGSEVWGVCGVCVECVWGLCGE